MKKPCVLCDVQQLVLKQQILLKLLLVDRFDTFYRSETRGLEVEVRNV